MKDQVRFAAVALLLAGSALGSASYPVRAETAQVAKDGEAANRASLEDQFRDPPESARPRVWWHWMNGNISKDGIAKDLAWMKRVGIGGLQNFDANLATPQIVDKRLVYMSPEWKDAFRFAASEADRLGLELAIASSPGWSETGGPWVPAADGMKKLVWSETTVPAGVRFTGKLATPPDATGPFQSIAEYDELAPDSHGRTGGPPKFYADAVVVAFPVASASPAQAVATGTDGRPANGGLLTDDDFTTGIPVVKKAGATPTITLEYRTPQTVRAARLFMPRSTSIFTGSAYNPVLEASQDGTTWTTIAEVPLSTVPVTVGFAPTTARHFRMVFGPVPSGGFKFDAQAPGVNVAGMAMGMAAGNTAFTPPPPPLVTDFRLFADDRVDRSETKGGFTIVPDYFALARDLPEVDGIDPERVIDLSSRLKADGSLDWTLPRLPRGQHWKVLRMGYSLTGKTNHPATPEATGLEVDKFDAPAVRRYLDHYLGMYRDAAGPELVGSRGVRALLTDSIEVGPANWSPAMIAHFKRLRGYDPVPWLPSLTGIVVGSRAQSDKFLFDFRRTLADLLSSEHYGTIAAFARENGLTLYGEALENSRPSLGDDMSMRRHADIPMAALWTYSRLKGPQLNYLADMKGASSVAHIYGKKLVAAESMTAMLAPWAFGPNDLKRVIDLEFAHGINRPVVHTSVHVPTDDKKPGLTLAIFGQYFNRNESWAELAKPWLDYISRNSLLLQQGRNVADVAYFYGEEAPLTGLYTDKKVPDAPRSVAYDFLNAEALHDALANEGNELVTPGGARYRMLYLGGSSSQMTLPTLRKIAQLVEGGATLVGSRPVADPGLQGDRQEFDSLLAKLWPGGDLVKVGNGQVIASNDIEAALRRAGIAPDFRFTGGKPDSEIMFVHRKLHDGDSYFVNNRMDRTETIEAHFRVTGKAPELWRAETGTSEPLSYRIENGETIVPLTFSPDDAVHVIFRREATVPSLSVTKPVPVVAQTIGTPWNVAFEAGRGAPAKAVFDKLAPLDTNADPGIKYFSGIATYANTFATPKGWKTGDPLWVDLGEAREVAEVVVNGRSAGHAWRAPYRVNIGTAARKGRNTIEVRVANLWVNRLIGDAQPGASKVAWTPTPTYVASAPLRKSGLIGPVTILVEDRQGEGMR